LVLVNLSVAANEAYKMTGGVAGVVTCPVVLAVVAFLTLVLNSIATFLGRRAIMAAFVEDKHASSVHLTVDDIAIVAGLILFLDPVAAAADVDTDRLVGRALLAFLATQAKLFAEIGLGVEDAGSTDGAHRRDHGYDDAKTPASNGMRLSGSMHGSPPAQWLTVTDTPSMSADTTGTMATPAASGFVSSRSIRWGRFRYRSTAPAAMAAPPAMYPPTAIFCSSLARL